MKTLHLTLKKKWFDMILSGEKKEEYREIKRHWIQQFVTNRFTTQDYKNNGVISLIKDNAEFYSTQRMVKFDSVTFKNGYAADVPEMEVELLGISINQGMRSWGAEPDTEYFVLSLGNIISTKNCTSFINLKTQ